MTNQVVYLHRFITQHFSLEELQMLCLDLGIEYEELPGWSTRSAKSRELILRTGAERQLEALLEELRKSRTIPFNQAGLSTESSLVASLYDDLDEYGEESRPFWERWQRQLQLDVRRVFIFLVIILVGLMAGTGFLYMTLRPDRPKEMSGEFNIAIAEFGQFGEDGRLHASEEGADLSATIFSRVQREVDNLPTDIVVEVWHNVMRPGVRLDFIQGGSSAERAAAAAALAERINADLIIYGNLGEAGNGFQFVPEFYVAELPNAGELVGAHGLGTEIAISGPANALGSTLQFNEKLAARTNALTLFIIGLAWEMVGRPERALELFYQAEQVEGWEDSEGKEILYLFIGWEAQVLWQRGEDRSEEARTAMQKAIDLNPNYGRAYIGLGNYYRELAEQQYDTVRALRLEEGHEIEADVVLNAQSQFHRAANQAISYYRQALDHLPTSAQDLVETKVRLALGGMHNRQGALLLLLNEHNTAAGYFDAALAENQAAYALAEADDYRHLGLAQLGIALAYHQKAYIRQVFGDPATAQTLYEKALESYSACIALAAEDTFDWFLQAFMEEQCTPGRRDVEDELTRLREESHDQKRLNYVA